MQLDEAARTTPVVAEVDVCVIGGSCTGVFAAVQAARRGRRVALIELHNQFGGVATARLVNVWHSRHDLAGTRALARGLSEEVVSRLAARGAVIERPVTDPNWTVCFNAAELACELDVLVAEHPGIRPFLHARLVGVAHDGPRLSHAIIEDKSGRRAIAARVFIDASGDADLAHLAGAPTRRQERLQPPTMAGIIDGLVARRQQQADFSLNRIIFDPARPRNLNPGFCWSAAVPGCPGLTAVFGTRIHGVDCSDADQLTRAEMAGREQLRRIVDLVNEDAPPEGRVALAALPACIGIRQTRQAICRHRLGEQELLHGEVFADAIAWGTYRVDVHHQGGAGLTFRYLDGRETIVAADGSARREGRWREPLDRDPDCYGIPYRCLVPASGPGNLLVAGRCLDADEGAYGAVRVMITCNQMGEAAGVAADLAIRSECQVAEVDITALRAGLAAFGNQG